MAYTTINKSTDYFNTITYTGNDTDGRTITGVGFQSDWTWVKARSSAFSHYIIDAIRYDSGASKYLKLDSSSTALNETPSGAGWISTLNSDGYVCKNGTSNTNNCNENGVTYVAWNWLGANGTATNYDGSITSTVSANTTAGFSIIDFTGNETNSSVGHGLGVAPSMFIMKRYTDDGYSSTTEWYTYHKSLASDKYLRLQSTASVATNDGSLWNTSTPVTSSVINIGLNANSNHTGNKTIIYAFAEKKGYSKFGSYTGNGNADGTFIYTGFKPAFVILKNTNATQDWSMKDNKRPGYNVTDDILYPNGNYAEGHGGDIDILSNGFKTRTTADNTNQSGSTFIYMAFAEAPLVGSNNVPCTAR
jgi:hypothetical protein